MRIDGLTIRNFRKFESLHVEFDSEMNILVGNNGAGKSSVLSALAVGVGSFFLGIEGVTCPGINKADIRLVTREIGSVLDQQPQLPVEISCNGVLFDEKTKWTRTLNTETGSTTHKDAEDIKVISRRVQNEIRHGNQDIILPIISYYGTGRLWSQKKDTNSLFDKRSANRFNGYTDCLSSSSNEKLMKKWLHKMTMIELQDQIKLPELTAVENAVAECFSDSGIVADRVRVRYGVKSEELEVIYLDGDGKWQKHPFHELSDGFKNTMSLVADIAYRMAVLNPQLLGDAIKKTTGIVIIDEIDQHLHPMWQRKILKSLMRIFPKVQFVVTTHSPSIISSSVSSKLIQLEEDSCSYPAYSYGKDSNSVLSEIMQVSPRPEEIQTLLDRFNSRLDAENYSQAKAVLNELIDLLGEDNSDVVGTRAALDFENS